MAFEPLIGDDDDFAVFDFAQEFRADDIERAGFGREHVGRPEPADDQWPNADRIARADHHIVGQADERVGAFDLTDRIDEALDDAALLRTRQEMKEDFGIRGRLADGAGRDQLAP